ncbi:MAG: glycine cleavage system aminomethyltransferase GcvT [Corynebacterium sp.]|nr:glycine cleavage system aminomethyltransferase GcvT [Corynebacterium sp.]
MTDNTAHEIKHSPLESTHVGLGATMVEFAGWNMPLKYTSDLEEHRAVREVAGLFDLSHMGEFTVAGVDAAALLNYVFLLDANKLSVGRAKYTHLVNADGTIIDDLIIYRLGEQEFFIVPNAANTAVDWETLSARAAEPQPEGYPDPGAAFDVRVVNQSDELSNIAIQGPQSEAILSRLIPAAQHEQLSALKYYAAEWFDVAGMRLLVGRTGYTGEDGFEIYAPFPNATQLWDALMEAGQPEGLIPAGLASRDSLRLEAGMPLYGDELTAELTTVDAGMRGIVGKEKVGDFYGRALLNLPVSDRKLVGLNGTGRRAARHGTELYVPADAAAPGADAAAPIGHVTSGLLSPTLGYPIALAYVDRTHSELGTVIEADIRGKRYPMTVVKPPFYTREQ